MAERRKEKKERRRTMTLPYWQKRKADMVETSAK